MRPVAHDRRIVLLALAAAIPGIVTALAILWTGDYSSKLRWTLTVVIVLTWLGFTQALRERVVRPLQIVSNLLSAMREEDFSIRARGSRPDDPLGEVLIEVNALAETVRAPGGRVRQRTICYLGRLDNLRPPDWLRIAERLPDSNTLQWAWSTLEKISRGTGRVIRWRRWWSRWLLR